MSWPTEPLGDLARRERGSITDGPFGSNLTSAHYTDEGPLVVRLQNIGDGVFNRAPAHISDDHFESLRKHEVLPGDLLVASLGEVLPRACLAPPDLGRAIVKADCIRIRLAENVEPRWVSYALQRPEARRWAAEHLHGVGRPRLGLKLIREIPVPVPPLDEQRRIVDILEDHLSRLDAATALVRSGMARLGLLEHASLSAATGLAEAPRRVLADLLEEPLSNGRSVKTRDGGFPVLRLTALRNGVIDVDERKAGDWGPDEAKPFLVRRGDFFVARGNGSLDLVARGGRVVSEPDPVAFPDTMIRIRTRSAEIEPDFFTIIWNSRLVRSQVERLARTTAGIYKINQSQLSRVVIPVPELDVQRRVAQSVALTSSAAERTRAALDSELARAARLRRALLTAAFSGRLTGRSSDLDLAEELIDA